MADLSTTTIGEDIQALIADTGQDLVDALATIASATGKDIKLTLTATPSGTANASFGFREPEPVAH